MKLQKRIKRLLFPPRCVFCQTMQAEEGMCKTCASELPRRPQPRMKSVVPCVDELYVPLYYEGYVRSAILRYKFGGVKCSGREFAKLMEPCIREGLDGRFDCITWVPTSRARSNQRGYDQSEVLARELGKLLDAPVVSLLKKCRNNPPQSRQGTREQRVANTLGVFDMKPESVIGKSILLIDDIATTGTTLSECARVLKTAGAERVYAATIAKKRLFQKKN